MSLTSKQTKYLKGLAHNLSAVVQVGQSGITDSVVRQIEQALDAHELIKVQVPFEGRERKESGARLAAESFSELVQVIGKIVVLYRPHPEEPEIVLPKIALKEAKKAEG